jgi:hypothetical protein
LGASIATGEPPGAEEPEGVAAAAPLEGISSTTGVMLRLRAAETDRERWTDNVRDVRRISGSLNATRRLALTSRGSR